jgi:hypothetical protein
MRTPHDGLGRGDLLRLIYDLCQDAKRYTDERCFGWARDCLLNAKLAAEAYAILVEADATEIARGE